MTAPHEPAPAASVIERVDADLPADELITVHLTREQHAYIGRLIEDERLEASLATVAPVPDSLTAADRAAVARRIADSSRPNTQRAYRTSWAAFERWCAEHGHESLPAAPWTVAAHLDALAGEGKALSTITLARAAIAKAHKVGGFDSPTDHEDVLATIRGIRNALREERREGKGRGRGSSRPLRAEDERAILAALPDTRSGRLTRALIVVGRDAMLRRSELAAMRWGDVERQRDGTGVLTVPVSKTSDEPAALGLSPAAMAALDAIRPDDAGDGDPVFLGQRGPLSGTEIARRIRQAGRDAGLGDGFSGHSMRHGAAVDLAFDGVRTPELLAAGRWRNATMVATYTRGAEAAESPMIEYRRRRGDRDDAGGGHVVSAELDALADGQFANRSPG